MELFRVSLRDYEGHRECRDAWRQALLHPRLRPLSLGGSWLAPYTRIQ